MKQERFSSDPSKQHIRAGRVILSIVLIVFVVSLVASLLSLILTGRNGKLPNVFGYHIFVTETDSMEPIIPSGTAVLVRACDASALKVGDFVTFRDGYNAENELIVNTHRVTAIEEKDGVRTLRVRGDHADWTEERDCPQDAVIGKTLFTMALVGEFVTFVKTPIGIVACIAIVLFVLLVIEVIHLIRISRIEKENPFAWDEKDKELTFADEDEEEPDWNFETEELPQMPKQRTRDPWKTESLSSEDNAALLYRLNVPTEQSDVPIETVPSETNPVSYIKSENELDFSSPRHATMEFQLPGLEKPTASPAFFTLDTHQSSEENPHLPEGERYTAFAADMAAKGQDHFVIEGIDVNVRPEVLNLEMHRALDERDIVITVTRDYTHVIVGANGKEVDFALLHDEAGEDRKVVIQRKNR